MVGPAVAESRTSDPGLAERGSNVERMSIAERISSSNPDVTLLICATT